MRLGLTIGYSGPTVRDSTHIAKLADDLGYHSVWTAEAYGSDAITPLVWMGAHTTRVKLATGIMQIPARTPAMTAMTAATLDALSGGRFICGIGMSGPQVVEGWHGVEYGKPLVRTREYVEILRAIWRRDKPLEHSGEHYTIPVRGGTGLGKPLKSILHPRPDIPVYLAAIGPKNVALAAEICDGVIPSFFSPYRAEVFAGPIAEGRARRHPGLGSDFDLVGTTRVLVTDDVAAGLATVKPQLALYIGGMGARGRNFYFNLACRYGYEEAAVKIQDAYLGGRKDEAVSLVPDELADEVSLVGPRERIADRLGAWRASGVGTLLFGAQDPDVLRMMAELVG